MTQNKSFMGFVNTILQYYGVCIKLFRKSAYDSIKKANKDVNYYIIDYCDDIDSYL